MSNIMSIIFILAAVGITFGYTNPRWSGETNSADFSAKSVAELKIDKEKYNEALEKTRQIEEVRNGLLTKYNSIKETDRARIEKMMPDNIDSVRLIIDINNVASSYGMSLREISLSDAGSSYQRKDSQSVIAESQGYTYMNLIFSVTGKYDDVISFLGSLERSLRIADVTALNLASVSSQEGAGGASSKGKTAEPQYKLKLSVKTYFLADK